MNTPKGGSALERELGALLLNPPIGGHRTTISIVNLTVAMEIIQCTALNVANIFALATKDLPEINEVGAQEEHWLAARPGIEKVLEGADEVLLGWGVGGLRGEARRHQQEQIVWVGRQLVDYGHTRAWSVSERPRHPSRWRQYVGPQRAVASGGTFEARLASVLRRIDLTSLTVEKGKQTVTPMTGFHTRR